MLILSYIKKLQKTLFEEDKKLIASVVEKIKNGTAKFQSIEEVEEKLNLVIKAYED